MTPLSTIFQLHCGVTLESTEWAIKNGQSRETDNIRYCNIKGTVGRNLVTQQNIHGNLMLNASLILTVHTIDTSTGELLVPEGILRPVVSASALTWFTDIMYLGLKFTVVK